MRDETNEHQPFALPGAHPQYGPDKLVAVEHIDLHLTPDMATESLDGICTMTVRALDEPVSRLTLDAVDLAISGVERMAEGQARSVCTLRVATASWKLNSSGQSRPASGQPLRYDIVF